MDAFVRNQRELDELEPRYKATKATNEKLRAEVHELMEAVGVGSFQLDGLGRFRRDSKGPYASLHRSGPDDAEQDVNEDARAQLEAWARSEKDSSGQSLFDVLFAFMPRMQRLSSLCRQRIEEGYPPPPGVDLRVIKTIAWTRDPAIPNPAKEKERARRAQRT